MGKLINKIIRKISGSSSSGELSQITSGAVLGGEGNKELIKIIRRAGADGCVLLKNNGMLPLGKENTVSVFGRVQYDYFTVGNGSGGDVCVPYKMNLIDALSECKDISLNESLKNKYIQWCTEEKNVPDPGFWAHWPRYYEEMPLDDETVKNAGSISDCAVVVIGRSAGEDRENVLEKGSYYLTDKEIKMLGLVTKYFEKVAVILNIGSIIDFSVFDSYGDKINALMIVWQGGMESGRSVSDVLTGKVNPSGRLTDSIAKSYEDYPSSKSFGNKESNKYTEDIFVGYRYFETFAPEKVLYEFGYGLSYTSFDIIVLSADEKEVKVSVKNTGDIKGREVVQLYVNAPDGRLSKASKVLAAFEKTKQLAPNEEQEITLKLNRYYYSSFDDSGASGYKNSYVLEKGEYTFYLGTSIKKCRKIYSYILDKDVVLETLQEIMPVNSKDSFDRLTSDNKTEKVPVPQVNLKERMLSNLPEETKITGDRGIKLCDVKNKKASLDEFTAQLSLEELELITRGEGMVDSSFGPKGNVGIFGGVSKSLRDKGIPPIVTTDGPSGIRLLSSCSLIPNATALACTWDTHLVEEIYNALALEMADKKTDVLLAPGMNIHRNPLCGRNFEYFSEDPFLSGKFACAVVHGIQSHNLSACPKHFACNNQEYNRSYNNSIVSQKALREIYLKPFEICVKESSPKNIMTSYNKINGVWSHYNYDLCTTVLRNEWGYEGNVITDWWMRYSSSPEFPKLKGNAYRVRAQVDVLMPGARSSLSKTAKNDGTLLSTYGKPGGITLGELQRSAKNVLKFILSTDKV